MLDDSWTQRDLILKITSEKTVTNGGIFFHRSATAPILATLYDIVHPGRFLSPQGDGGKGKFQLLFDDDASPTRAVALFYRRLPIEILIEIRETRRKTLPKSLKRNLSRQGELESSVFQERSKWLVHDHGFVRIERCSIRDKKVEFPSSRKTMISCT